MESAFKRTAKAYIEYRAERTRVREAKTKLMQTYDTISQLDAEEDSDVKRGNANVDGNSAMGKMLQFGAEGSKEYAKICILKPEFSWAHDHGDIHIHDLDFLATGTLACCQTDVRKLFEHGFNTGHGFLRTPQSIGTAAALAAIILQANQNEQHGGQSIPYFDYCLAPSVNKTFRKALKENLEKYEEFTGKDLKIEIKDDITLGDEKKLKKPKFQKSLLKTRTKTPSIKHSRQWKALFTTSTPCTAVPVLRFHLLPLTSVLIQAQKVASFPRCFSKQP